MLTLRDYQQRAVDNIRDAYRRGFNAPLYQLATGGGKGVILTYVAAGAAEKGNRVWILAHRQELIRQIEDHLVSQLVRHDVIAAGRPVSSGALVSVASVQTLVRRLDRYPPPDLIVVDEAHHATAESWSTILTRFPSSKILGVTATPCRLNGAGLDRHFDHLIQGPSTQSLISAGFLARPVYYAPPSGVRTDDLHIVAGDFNRRELDVLMDRPTITGSAVETYTKLAPGRPALAFCTSLKHAANVTAQFNAVGYRAAMIDGKMDDDVRATTVSALRNGELQILVSCEILNEGFDVPGVEVAILLRPTASLALHLQQIGRALRPGKSTAKILDHVGNVLRHGFAEEPREWSLKGAVKRRESKEQVFPNRQCPSCYRVHGFALACPECGFVYPIKAREVRHTEGSLEEINAEEVAKRRASQEVGMAKTFAELHAIEKNRGYKSGWAYFQWRMKKQRGIKTRGVAAEQGVLLP